jgi:hypothetical protein
MALRGITPALAPDSVVLFTALVVPGDVAKSLDGSKTHVRTTKTESYIRKLVRAAGLEIANFHRADCGNVTLIEARLAKASANRKEQGSSTDGLALQKTTTIAA